jgi:rRNA processing protein Krr1/Pno1
MNNEYSLILYHLLFCLQAQIEIHIPREHHKYILGKGGKALQQLELTTATKITIPRDGSDTIKIVGTKEGVDRARHELQIISDEQVIFNVFDIDYLID